MSLSSDIRGHPVAIEFFLCFLVLLLLRVCLLTDVNPHAWVLSKSNDKEVAFGCIPSETLVETEVEWEKGKDLNLTFEACVEGAGVDEAGKSQKTMTRAQRMSFLGDAHWCSEHWLLNSTLFYICSVPSNSDWCLEEHSQTCCCFVFSPETQSLPRLTQVRFSGFNCWLLCLKKNLLAVQR